MPSLAQLQAEPWWSREVVTDELDWLGDELCRRTGRPRDAFGSKGNTVHLNGGHRSQEWILNSDWCTNTSYTVQSGLTSTQLRHIAAGDFTPGAWGTSGNRALMVKHTAALFAAARRGELTGVRQIFGTLNGRNAVGLNVLSNSTTTPDASHLDHLHFTFDRRYLRDIALMKRIADIITGDDMPLIAEDVKAVWQYHLAPGGYNMQDHLLNAESFAVQTRDEFRAFRAQEETRDAVTLAAIQALSAGGGNIDTAVILERINAQANATRDLVEQQHAAEMAELSRIHAAQMAEKQAELAGLQAELDRLNAS